MRPISERLKFFNMLERLWWQQKKYNDAVKGLQSEKQNWTEVYLLGLISQVHEILEQTRWKRNRVSATSPLGTLRENVAPALADLTKFVLCLWQEQGFTMEEMLEAVTAKNVQLEQQLQLEFFPAVGSKVIVSDLDGTGADYRAGFEAWWGRTDEVKTLAVDLDNRVPYMDYTASKDDFERTGGYANLPAYADWVSLIRGERNLGTGLLITTARPAHELKRIWGDTMQWLKRQNIEPDSIVFGRDERILELVNLGKRANMVVLLEDDATLALRAAHSGIHVMLRTQPYNLAVEHPLIHRYEKFPALIPWHEYYVDAGVPKFS